MDNIANHGETEEVIIDLSDLFAQILRRWKSVIAVGLIGAVIGVLLTFVQTPAVMSEEDITDQALQEAQGTLTESEIESVNQVYQQYVELEDALETDDLYRENSILYNMNSSDILEYRIEYSYVTSNPELVSSYQSQTLTEDDLKAIAKAVGQEDKYLYAGDLVTISGGTADDSSTNITYTITDDSGSEIEYQGMLEVAIKADSKERVEAIAQIVRDAIDRHTKELEDSGVSLTIQESSAEYYTTYLSQVKESGSIAEPDMDSYNSAVDELSEDQKTYLEYLVTAHKIENGTYQADTSVTSSAVKNGIIGLVIGIVVMIFVYLLAYVCSGSLKTAEDLERLLQKHIFGVLQKTNTKKGMGGAIERRCDKMSFHGTEYHLDAQLPLIASRIARIASDSKANNVYLMMDEKVSNEKELVDMLKTQKELSGVEIRSGNPMIDMDLLQNLKEGSVCVISAKLKTSRREDIEQIVTVCQEAGANIIGGIVFA